MDCGQKPQVPLGALFFTWYAASVICTAGSKVLIRSVFPSAYWLSLAQFVVAALLGNLVVRLVHGKPPRGLQAGKAGRRMRRDMWALSATFSFGMLALNKGYECMHVSLVETLRATEPVVSAALVWYQKPEKAPSAGQLMTLVPIVLGACCSSFGASDFNVPGLLWVAVSNLCFCQRTIQYTDARNNYGLDSETLFYHICRLGSVCQLFYALVGDYGGLTAGVEAVSTSVEAASPATLATVLGLVLLNGAMYYTYLQFSWVVLTRVSIVTHAVGNSMRRPVVLICNVLYFRNEISLLNAAGIALAFTGVVLYSRAKKA